MTEIITQTKDAITITQSMQPKRHRGETKSIAYVAPFDGSEIKYNDAEEEEVTSRTTWNAAKTEIIEESNKKNKAYTTTRSMDKENDEMRVKVQNQHGQYLFRTFKRINE